MAGMASIERHDNRIVVKWRLGGKRTGAPQTLSIPLPEGTDPRDALELAEQARDIAQGSRHTMTRAQVDQIVRGDRPSAGAAPKFADWAGIYLAERRRMAKFEHDVQADTLDGYERILRGRAVPYLGHRRLDEITPDAIRDWLVWVQRNGARRGGKPLSPGTVHRFHAVLHACLGAAVPEHLPSNPAARPAGSRRRAPGLPKPVRFEGMFLDPVEVDAIWRHASAELRPLMFTLVRTGLRLGEALALQIHDVVLSGRRPLLRVRRAMKADGGFGPPKSAMSVRDVEISAAVVAVLAPLVKGRRGAGLVFRTPTGKKWNKNNLRNRYWLPAVAAARACPDHPQGAGTSCADSDRLTRTQNPRLHDLRHTHASALIEHGWSVVRVQRRLGHASATVTLDTYAHAWQRVSNREVNDVDRMFDVGPAVAA